MSRWTLVSHHPAPELHDWIKANMPELHERLVAEPPPIRNALRVLSEACGFVISPEEKVKDSAQRALDALKAKHAAGTEV